VVRSVRSPCCWPLTAGCFRCRVWSPAAVCAALVLVSGAATKHAVLLAAWLPCCCAVVWCAGKHQSTRQTDQQESRPRVGPACVQHKQFEPSCERAIHTVSAFVAAAEHVACMGMCAGWMLGSQAACQAVGAAGDLSPAAASSQCGGQFSPFPASHALGCCDSSRCSAMYEYTTWF
jgi:hypothetical protein